MKRRATRRWPAAGGAALMAAMLATPATAKAGQAMAGQATAGHATSGPGRGDATSAQRNGAWPGGSGGPALTPAVAAAPGGGLAPAAPTPTQDIGLSDAMARAMAKNRDLVIERETRTQADAGIERARAAYDPTLRGDLRYRDQQQPVTSLLSGAPAGELAPTMRGVVSSASFSKLFSSGATATLSGSVARDSSNNFITLISPAWSTAVGVDFRQPLLQNREVDPARRAIKVARITRDRSELSLRRALLETVNAVEQAYWTLVAAQRDIDARRHGVELALQQRSDVATRIEAKVTAESDIAQPTAEIARRQGDLYAAEETRLRAERALKLLMLDGPDDPLWNAELRASDAPDAPASGGVVAGGATVDLQAALHDAQQLRPELADAAARVKLQDVEIESARDRLKPQLDLVASYTSRGLAGALNPNAIAFGGLPLVIPDDLQGGLGGALDSLARQRFPDASVGLSVNVPLGNRAAKADLATAESARRQAVTGSERDAQRIAVEVRNAVTALQTAGQRLDAARAGRDAAAVQLQAEQDRFGAGMTTTFFVLTRQNDLVAAEVTESAALAAYRRALAELARARGTLLRDRNIDIR
jgi:HAE1 family hydrophobic/amphiphilic exporter-1